VIPAMRIQVGSLSEGTHQYRFRPRASELGLSESFTGEVSVDVTLEKTGSQIFLSAIVSTGGTFSCDRCTGLFEYPLAAAYRMCYMSEGSEAIEMDTAEAQPLPADSGIIDISDDVRQTVLLAVPLKLLCQENCEGICPQCGTNLNVKTCSCNQVRDDPRWETLRQLRGNS